MKSQTVKITIDDDVLVRKCVNGDNAAADTLIRRYQNRIYNVILKMCANPEDAADLTQDTFVKAIQNIAKFQKKSSFYTWLFRIAVNSTITHCKKNAKLAASSLDAEYCQNNNNASNELKAILTDPDAPDPAKIAQNRELCDLLLKTLLKLDEDHRAVIVLRDIEGMNYAQIANVLDIQVGTVKSRLSRARNNLRDLMEVIAS